ncbi:unnamed protein product [Phytophthora fragariaefolia]|uniref:Unnamed protein product n=1 Tax=Phytophthora fragariaefolia TaxID=1490495 RepID=A0A9W6X2S0_9STRA|nr:unnamed protein product [Phytophthora fragariaefolia]
MAAVFIALDGKLDFSVLNVVTDVLVGVFMIALGVYGVLEGVKKARRSRRRGASRRKRPTHKGGGVQDESEDDEAASEGADTETETDSVASPKGAAGEQLEVTFSDEREASPAAARQRLQALKKDVKDEEEDAVVVDVVTKDVSPQMRQHSTSVESISLENSPCESVVALEELLSDHSQLSDDVDAEIDTARGTGPKCCGLKLPTIDFQNARTQKVCTTL